MKTVLWLCSVVLLVTALRAAQEVPAEAEIQADVRLSRTAIHVGDVFEYEIVIKHSDRLSFITDDLQNTFVVAPFELRKLEVIPSETANVIRLLLTLSYYERPGRVQVPALRLFYYERPRGGSAGRNSASPEVSAKEFVIGAQDIQVNPTSANPTRIRDSVSTLRLSRTHYLVPVVTAFALLLAGGLGARWGIRQFNARRKGGVESKGALRQSLISSFQKLEPDGNLDGRLFCLHVSQWMRRYLQFREGIEGDALTPEEIKDALTARGWNAKAAERVEAILQQCDSNVCGPEGPPSEERGVLYRTLKEMVYDDLFSKK
ncbi:MAG: hypothetical protein HY645_03090 [Acidobacteria bacterium]|nr:hypothetical protein [Acidobacteriota bacterium]